MVQTNWRVSIWPFQITTEDVLFGYRGKFQFDKECMGNLKTWFEAPVQRPHSTKPQEFYDNLLTFTYPPRLDVFARQKREGFDGWGNEYPMLEVV